MFLPGASQVPELWGPAGIDCESHSCPTTSTVVQHPTVGAPSTRDRSTDVGVAGLLQPSGIGASVDSLHGPPKERKVRQLHV
jgi:hypothetical protein